MAAISQRLHETAFFMPYAVYMKSFHCSGQIPGMNFFLRFRRFDC